MFTELQMFESPDLNPLDFFFGGGGGVYKRNVDERAELVAGKLDAVASIKKREEQLRRTTHDLRAQVAKCIEPDGGICKNSL